MKNYMMIGVAVILVAVIVGSIVYIVSEKPPETKGIVVEEVKQVDTNLSHLETATVQANVVNSEDKEVSETLTLKVAGESVDEQSVTLGPEGSETVEFKVPPRDPGEYTMEVAGKTGTLTVNQFFVGYSPFLQAIDYCVMKRKMSETVADHLGYRFMFKDPNCDPVEQKKQVEFMIANGVHAIVLVSTVGESQIPEICQKNDVILITQDADANSPKVDLAIKFGQRKPGNILAGEIVKFLEDKYGEPKGLIFNIQMELTSESGVERSEGVHDVVDEYPDIKVIDLPSEASPDQAFKLVKLAIEAHGKPDAMYGAVGGITLAGFKALEGKGWAIPAGEEGHIYVATYDAEPGVLSKMRQKLFDVAYAQPMPFYAGLGVYYAGQIEGKGRDVIPQIGTTLTAEDAPLHEMDIEFMGVNVWKDPYWAPAYVDNFYGHPWIRPKGILVTLANVDSTRLWGNLIT